MMDKNITTIPERSIAYFLICLSGFLIFLFTGIVPGQRSLIGLDRNIDETRSRIEEQKRLLPIYQSLNADIKKTNVMSLPFPSRERLPKDGIDGMFSEFREIAGRSNLQALYVVPDLNSLSGNPGMLPVEVTLRGDYFNLRRFLIGLGKVPYVDRVEEIEIRQNKGAKEFRIKVLLALG